MPISPIDGMLSTKQPAIIPNMKKRAWYQLSTNPSSWAFGVTSRGQLIEIRATITRVDDLNAWQWCAFAVRQAGIEPFAQIAGGRTGTWDNARAMAEQALKDQRKSPDKRKILAPIATYATAKEARKRRGWLDRLWPRR